MLDADCHTISLLCAHCVSAFKEYAKKKKRQSDTQTTRDFSSLVSQRKAAEFRCPHSPCFQLGVALVTLLHATADETSSSQMCTQHPPSPVFRGLHMLSVQHSMSTQKPFLLTARRQRLTSAVGVQLTSMQTLQLSPSSSAPTVSYTLNPAAKTLGHNLNVVL
jgi:hypothetical protein